MDNIKTGLYIKEKRKEKGITQKQLADILNCTDKAVSRWETGKGFPEISMLLPISEALGVSVNELIIGEDIRQEEFVEKADDTVITTLEKSKKMAKKSHIIIFVLLVLIEIGAFVGVSITATPSDTMGLIFFQAGIVLMTTIILGFTSIKMRTKFIYIPITIILNLAATGIYFGDIYDYWLPYTAVYSMIQAVIILICCGITKLSTHLMRKTKELKQ